MLVPAAQLRFHVKHWHTTTTMKPCRGSEGGLEGRWPTPWLCPRHVG